MAATQILLLLVTVAVSDLALGQAYNGYINPLFLPRGLRRGRLYDLDSGDLRDNGYLLSRDDFYRRVPLGQDYNRYDDYRRYQRPYYDSDRRYPSVYDSDRRYPSPYDGYRRYSNSDDSYRRYPDGLDDRYVEDDRVRYLAGVGLASTAAPLDRGAYLMDGRGLRLEQGMSRGGLVGLESGQGQILSTSTPELSVSVSPNSST